MVYGRCCTEVRRRAPYTSLSSFLHMWSWFRVLGSLCSSYLLSFWPNWVEGNNGIPVFPKYPLLPCHGLTGKRLLSELPYKLVPSTILIEKIAFMWTLKIKKFIFLDLTEYWKEIQAANQQPPVPLLVILSASEESRYALIVTPASYKQMASSHPHCHFNRSEADWRKLRTIRFPAASLKICTIWVFRLWEPPDTQRRTTLYSWKLGINKSANTATASTWSDRPPPTYSLALQLRIAWLSHAY